MNAQPHETYNTAFPFNSLHNTAAGGALGAGGLSLGGSLLALGGLHRGGSGVGGHGGVGLHHEGKSTNELTVGLEGGVGGQVHTHIGTPAEDDVQVSIRDGELVAHQVVVALQHVGGNVLKLGGNLLELSLLGVTLETTEQGAERSVQLTGEVVEVVDNQVSVLGTVLSSDLARSLKK